MKLIKTLPIFLGLFANSFMANALENESACNITFNELLSEGLRTHPSITVSKKQILGSELQLNSAKWGYYPTPSIDISKSSDKNRTIFRLDQPLWTGGKIDAEYDKAKAQKDEAIYSYEESQYKLIDDYANSLQDYLQAKDKIDIMSHTLSQLKSIMTTVDRMIEAGELGIADKNLLNTRMADIESNLTIAKAELEVAKIQFEILTGDKIDCNIVLYSQSKFDHGINIEDFVESALEFNPSLRILNAKIDAAGSDVLTAKSKLWPTLKLRAEHRDGSLFDSDSDIKENLVYLVFEMSTGAGASALSNIQKSKINVLKVKNQKLAKEKQVIDSLMGTYTRFVAVKNNIDILSNDVDTAKKVYDSNKRMFFLQQKKWIEVVNSLIVLNNKKVNRSKLIGEYKVLEINLALKTGKLSLNTGEYLSELLQ